MRGFQSLKMPFIVTLSEMGWPNGSIWFFISLPGFFFFFLKLEH